MFHTGRIQSAAVAIAMMAGASMALVQPADASPRHGYRPLRVTGTRFLPAQVKVGYVGAPGYPYGPPGPVVPLLIDPGLGGGFLGVGLVPAIGLFAGFPVLGALRL